MTLDQAREIIEWFRRTSRPMVLSTCSRCNGSGHVTYQGFTGHVVCPRCNGKGETYEPQENK